MKRLDNAYPYLNRLILKAYEKMIAGLPFPVYPMDITHPPKNRLLSPIRRVLGTVVHAWVDAIFPPKCAVCGGLYYQNPKEISYGGHPVGNLKENTSETNNHPRPDPMGDGYLAFTELMRPYLCPTCLPDFLPIESPLCTRCGIMFKSRKGVDHVCGQCHKTQGKFEIARAVGVYDKSLMGLIHALKYKGKIRLVRPLSRLLLAAFNRFWSINTIDLVIPIPLHIKRIRRRGFNQSFLLVKTWHTMGDAMHVDFSSVCIDNQILVRNRWTEPQTGLGRKERLANIKDAFCVIYPERVYGKHVLLVDDVVTTGSTVEECAKVLLKTGALQVDVLTLARAI